MLSAWHSTLNTKVADAHVFIIVKENSAKSSGVAESGRERQRAAKRSGVAESSREQQRAAESSREQQRAAESGLMLHDAG